MNTRILRSQAALLTLILAAPSASAQYFWTDQAADNDRFGQAVAVADFDGDGENDLAVGIPNERVQGTSSAGAVRVYYTNGSIGSGWKFEQYWNEALLGHTVHHYDQFGKTLAAGDFDCDGYIDLAVGAPGDHVGSRQSAGAVFILRGSASGLTANANQYLHQNSPGVPGGAENYDNFASALCSADFDADGCDDLAVGVPHEDIGSIRDAGAVHVFFGSFQIGLSGAGDQIWWEGRNGAAGVPEQDNNYGMSLAAGDFDANGLPDLAIGVPYDDLRSLDGLRTAPDAGRVVVLYSRPNIGPDSYSQDYFPPVWVTQDVLSAREFHYGEALTVGDFDYDGIDDLAIGAPNAEVGINLVRGGAVYVIEGGSPYGLAWPTQVRWSQDSDLIAGWAEAGDRFGAELSTGSFHLSGNEALVIGVPGEALGSINNAGVVQVFSRNFLTGGIGGSANQMWHQNSSGIAEVGEANDAFGTALATGDLNGNGVDDLVIGVPGESIGGHSRAGAVQILQTDSEIGIINSGDVLLHEFIWTFTTTGGF